MVDLGGDGAARVDLGGGSGLLPVEGGRGVDLRGGGVVIAAVVVDLYMGRSVMGSFCKFDL